ncbi:MAG: cobyric acid synthase [Acidimicrobiia bacterium]|nr:cobyric acid synthase [Acidimicrobiia bacterium]
MVQGTASGVGKSLLVAGLCRLLARSGVRVAPFKPQNMSNAAAACPGGGEIGRAQALQAFACGIEPSVDMNPVLIKPEADCAAQLVVLGEVRGRLDAERFREARQPLLHEVIAAFERLAGTYDFIVVEGAGSPAEPNLRVGDIANMGFAREVSVPVWLVADIDRGGSFAALLGTVKALEPAARALVEALLVNRFRGEPALLEEAFDWLAARTGLPVLGAVPYLPELLLPEEDAPYAFMDGRTGPSGQAAPRLRVGAVHYPRASNIADVDPLVADPAVAFAWLGDPGELAGLDLVILPGSKAVASDLAWLRDRGWVPALERHLRYGGRLLGVCGGLQMLGRRILDPLGIEGPHEAPGLGWLDLDTVFGPKKLVRQVTGRATWPEAVEFAGYEIRHGGSEADPALYPFSAASADHRILGTPIHGLLDRAGFRGALLQHWLAYDSDHTEDQTSRWCRDLDRLADTLAAHLDLTYLEKRVGEAVR